MSGEPRRHPRALRLGALALAGCLVAPVPSLLGAAPSYADVAQACVEDQADAPTAVAGRTLESLRIPQLQQWFDDRGRIAGDGVVVAVLDSGVSTAATGIRQAGPQALVAGRAGADFYQGTAVAGIIAGQPESLPGVSAQDAQRIGIAPGAAVLDVKIFDNDGSEGVEGDVTPDSAAVATGLDRVLAALPGLPVKVVNLGVSVPDDPGVREKINQLWKRGVVTVTVAGDRVSTQLDPLLEPFASFAGGENAAGVVFPAAYDEPQEGRPAGRGIPLAATTTLGGYPESPEVTDFILQSTQIDLAVPTSGAPSYTLAGSSCSLRAPSSRWAAAEVSGILAALASAYPSARPAQLVSRLLNTTDGRADVPTALTGAGTAQPYEALTRPLRIDRSGDYDQTVPVQTQQKAEAPVTQTDPLVSTRQDMVWFGLVGGGVLVLALVLRPVLARRRSS